MRPLVSIDIFDTAIFRKVYKPTDIFDIVEKEVGGNFKELRVRAQEKALRAIPSYTILDIYKYLPKFNPREEIRAEYYNCEANPYILDMYNKGEADYIFISDMYLPSDVLKGMLEHCGYKNPEVYVSCEHGSTKAGGKLFKKVEALLGRKISKHIGDNYNCDILGAKKANIEEQEFVGPPIYNKEVVTPELKDVRLRKLIVDKELSNSSVAEKIGYLFAPLTLAFTKVTLDEAKDDQTIFFNARDGYVMYIIARWLLKTKKNIKYCRFSRKSCHFPNINVNRRIDSEYNEKAMKFFRSLRVQTIQDFLDTFDFEKDYKDELKELGITLSTNLDFRSDKQKLLSQFVTMIQTDIYEKARQERVNILKYIENLGMKDNDIFVDLGHFGSMQSIIHKITGYNLRGRYVHTFECGDYFKGVREDKASFLPKGVLAPFTGIVELIYSEPTGTVVSYTDKGVPVLNKDTKYRKEVVKGLLKGVIEGVKDILENKVAIYYDDCITLMNRFLYSPTLEEAKFGNSKLFENGSYKENESIVWFDKDLIRQGKLKECYNRSYWKTAFKIILENDKEYKSLRGIIK